MCCYTACLISQLFREVYWAYDLMIITKLMLLQMSWMRGDWVLNFEPFLLDLAFHSMLGCNFLPDELFRTLTVHDHYCVLARHCVND